MSEERSDVLGPVPTEAEVRSWMRGYIAGREDENETKGERWVATRADIPPATFTRRWVVIRIDGNVIQLPRHPSQLHVCEFDANAEAARLCKKEHSTFVVFVASAAFREQPRLGKTPVVNKIKVVDPEPSP